MRNVMSGRKSSKWWAGVLILSFSLLGGCGAKQNSEQGSSLFVSDANDDLSQQEKAALYSKGQVDKSVPDHAMSDIAAHYKYYLGKGRQDVCLIAKSSGHHLEYAKQVFKNRGMPEELANLAIVESGYRTNAVSRAGAAGAWQFIPATGQKYGLIQDQWQDDRLDPYKSTEAAAEYLNYLHDYFGDWPTAIAAYNAGEGKMSRAKLGTGGNDFFEVKQRNGMLDEKAQLRDETKNYVPRFLAVTKVMRNLPQLGFDDVKIDENNRVSRLKAAPGTDLTALSSACMLSWNDFRVYNQHLKRYITCTNRETFVYVPTAKERQASQYLAAHGKGDFAGWQLVKLKKNPDTLSRISKLSHVPLEKLRLANPGVNRLKSGQILLLPPDLKMPAVKETSVAAKETKSAPGKSGQGTVHKIQSNETLYAIARKYNIDVKTLQAQNSIRDPGQLKVGDTLKIPAGKGIPKASSYSKNMKKNYVVQPRDNLWSISRKFNVSVEDLKRWNKLGNQTLKPGLTLALSD